MCSKLCARCGMAASFTAVLDRRTLFFWSLFGLAMTIRTVSSESPDLACSSVKYAYTEKGLFREEDVPQTAIAGDHLRICEQGMTCCTQEMEHRLSAQSRDEFERHLRQTIAELKSVFALRAHKFDEFFRELMSKSKKGFHQMFVKTYGMIYETNAYIFEGMFKDLERYYDAGNVDLADALDGFFNRLYKKMFQVMNSQYTFSDKYLNCISEHMEDMKPFGDIPKKLTLEVKRSFVATRTYVQALGVGRDVVKVIMEVGPTPECSRSLMKMTYCPHCQGLPDLKPCASYCLGVMKECFSNYNELSSEWKNFTTALDQLAGRLENSFNIESVVDPLNIKISEAVMNFQENGPAVSQKLFESCGRPRLGKRANSELHFEKLVFSYQQNGEETSLSTLVQGIRKRIRKTANYWSQLPEKMCRNPDISGEVPKPQQDRKDQKDCWNGLSKAKLEIGGKQLGGDTTESKLETSHQNAIINQQILSLKLMTDKLQHAYNGQEVQWQDSDADWVSSGSGSGSGEEPNEASTVTDTYSDIYFSSSTPHPKVPRVPTVSSKPKKNSGPRRTPSWVLVLVLVASVWSRS